MCDETINLTRREFTAAGAAAVLAGSAGGSAWALERGLIEAMVEVKTPDGVCEAFFVHPSTGKHPGVVFWPDAIGLRETKKAMARQLAAEGYAVLVVNPYYRQGKLPLDLHFNMFADEASRNRIMGLMGSLNHETAMRDGAAFVAYLDSQPAVDTARGIGSQGYCMGGRMAVRTAAAAPGRVKAVASLHGGELVTGEATSPHKLLASTRAAFLFAIGKDDDTKAPTDKDALREAAAAAGRPAEIEVYAADHSWCVPDAPAYDAAEAKRAEGRILALYAQL